MVNVAQLVRALDCGSKGRGFESHLSPSFSVKQEGHPSKEMSFLVFMPFYSSMYKYFLDNSLSKFATPKATIAVTVAVCS